jgi:hypothetical protein
LDGGDTSEFGGQDVEVGDVFVEVTETRFSAGRILQLGGGKRRLAERKLRCRSWEDQDLGAVIC